MNAPIQKPKPLSNAPVGKYRPVRKAEDVLVDPATNRPVVRDLRFREFVAHRREFYFLNHCDSQ
jgi:hypothetical protein